MSWESFDGGFGNDPMLDRVRTVKFATTRLRAGYVIAEVDAFLGRAEAALTGGGTPLTADEVRGVQFTTTRLSPGYDEEQVDAFLDELEAYVTGGA